MLNEPNYNYVYQPIPCTSGDKIYAVGGLDVPSDGIFLPENYCLTKSEAEYRAWVLNIKNGRKING